MHASLTAPWFSGLVTQAATARLGLGHRRPRLPVRPPRPRRPRPGGRAGPESRIIMIGWRPEPSLMRRFRSRSHIMESSS